MKVSQMRAELAENTGQPEGSPVTSLIVGGVVLGAAAFCVYVGVNVWSAPAPQLRAATATIVEPEPPLPQAPRASAAENGQAAMQARCMERVIASKHPMVRNADPVQAAEAAAVMCRQFSETLTNRR